MTSRVLPARLAILVACVAVVGIAMPRAQQLDAYHVAGWRVRDCLEVKLRETSGLRPAGEGLAIVAAEDQASADRLRALWERARTVRPLVAAPFEVLDALHRRAVAALPAGATRPGHLGYWYELHCADAPSAAALLADLLQEPMVEDAYLKPVLQLASTARANAGVALQDLPPPTPDLSAAQTYKAAPPLGVHSEAARSVFGARGETVSLYHLEDDWIFEHEDLDSLSAASFVGRVTGQGSAAANHGTGMLGVTLASRNAYGMTGIADRARGRMISWALEGGIVNTIHLAIADGRPGDVIAIVGGYNLALTKPDDYVPAEYFQSNFDAIRTATAVGFLFVEAALNGNNDLDDARFARRFDLSSRDSGAILVGASAGAATTRAAFSNYGSRIDANGWGGDVATTGYGDLLWLDNDRRQAYSQGYAGTSAATALTTAVIVSLAGAVKQQRGSPLTPAELRTVLRAHGTPIAHDVGRRPDLVAMLRALSIPDGLEVDRHAIALGSAFTITMRGSVGGGFALALALGTARVELGLNRPLHLDPASLIPIGGFALADGTATWNALAPNDPSLRGLDVYFQGLAVAPQGGTPHVSSSVAIWLR